MIGMCKDCILFRCGYCFSEGESEKITVEITKCNYYLFSIDNEKFHDGFIQGFCYCDKMKKEPQIQRIETRAKQEVFNKLIDILKNNQFPEYVEDDLINYLISEGYDPNSSGREDK